MMGLRVFSASSDLKIAVEVGFVTGVSAQMTPTGSAISVMPVSSSCEIAALHVHGELATMAVEETGRGLFEDKAVKNMFAFVTGVSAQMTPTGSAISVMPVSSSCEMTPTVF
jgi:hypothetical protein